MQAVIRQKVDLQATMHAAPPLTARHWQQCLLVALDVLRHGVQVATGLLFMVSMPLLPHVPVVLHCQHCTKPKIRLHSTLRLVRVFTVCLIVCRSPVGPKDTNLIDQLIEYLATRSEKVNAIVVRVSVLCCKNDVVVISMFNINCHLW